jgi:hypothetical protein
MPSFCRCVLTKTESAYSLADVEAGGTDQKARLTPAPSDSLDCVRRESKRLTWPNHGRAALDAMVPAMWRVFGGATLILDLGAVS